MKSILPNPRPCSMCSSESHQRVKLLIRPRLGEIELSSSEIDAALFECSLCGAVHREPLQHGLRAA